MILPLALVAASIALAPQVPPNLRLPEVPTRAQAPVQRPVAEVEKFKRALEGLRGSPPEVEHTLQQMAQDFPDVEALIVQRLPSALPRELIELTVASRRFGTVKVADEMLFQLLARPVGDATRDLLETMVALKGLDSKKALRDCIRGRISGVRRIATEIMARLATADDLDFALELADDPMLDLQLSGIELLAVVPVDRARERLVSLLAREPTVAGAACMQLLRLGSAGAPFLQKVLAEPPIDRSFHYAAFVLAANDRDGAVLPPTAAVPALRAALGATDTVARGLAAVSLGRLCYYGQAPGDADRAVVAALLDIVAPAAFVPNFEMLRRPAEEVLRQLTGRAGTEPVSWRPWWKDTEATFAGLRARIDLGADDAGAATIALRGEQRQVRLVGEQLADLPPPTGAAEYVLDAAAMRQVVEQLQAAGFMRPGAIVTPPGLQPVRSLELVVHGARTMVSAPAQALPAFDALVAIVTGVADQELWQLLRHPTDEPERGAFWRAERRFRQSQTDPAVLDRRNLQRAIKLWPLATPDQRATMLAWLLALPHRRELVGEQDGAQLVEIVSRARELGEPELVLLELAAVAPGDKVWRDCLDVATQKAGGGRAAVDRLSKVLGADRVLLALGDQRPHVRRAAIDEVVDDRDLRAADRLVEMFDDPDQGVRRAAIFATGQLALSSARTPLVDRIAAEATDPVLRRDAMVALGRIGGEGVFAVLQRAMASPVPADREAALRGMGELKDERAALQLAQIFCASHGTPTAEYARSYLQRMGAGFAVPALRQQLEIQNEAVRSEIVLMLGNYLDPQVVPDLTDMLQRKREVLLVSALLSGTTGLDVDTVADPVTALRSWYRDHRLEPQWRWLLQALQRDKVKSSLDEAQFASGAGMVAAPELARLMVDAESGRIRALSSAVLRTVAGADYGQLTPSTPREVREAIAARYRDLYENARAAQGR